MTDDADLPIADRSGDAAGSTDDVKRDVDGISRRRLLARSVGIMGGTIAAGIGVPAVFYVAGPSTEDSGTQDWIRLGSVASVEPGEPTLMKATIERRSGYLTNVEELSVFVTTENGADFVALSNVCTHLGCRVRWVEDQNGFFCPCHNAVFNPDGSVGTGPPPRPLDRFETKVEDGQIFIRGV